MAVVVQVNVRVVTNLLCKIVKGIGFNMDERTCNKCGRVAFGVTTEFAEDEIKKFNEMYDNLTAGEKERYYGSRGASMKTYETCYSCGNNHTNFRKSKENDCPNGATLSPIIFDY